jgi:hypothetical protein
VASRPAGAYVWTALQNDHFMMLPINNVLKDLESNNELFVNLALSFAGSGALSRQRCSHSLVLSYLRSAVTTPHICRNYTQGGSDEDHVSGNKMNSTAHILVLTWLCGWLIPPSL